MEQHPSPSLLENLEQILINALAALSAVQDRIAANAQAADLPGAEAVGAVLKDWQSKADQEIDTLISSSMEPIAKQWRERSAQDARAAFEQWRIAFLGRNSDLMQIFDSLGSLPREERPAVGRRANQVKRFLETGDEITQEALRQVELARSLQAEHLDVTLPGRPLPLGRLHPVTLNLREIYRIFADMGFQIYLSREVETDEYNFQLLNFPPNHPARDMQDSYYIQTERDRGDDPVLLRTHTTSGQIHAMRESSALNPADPPPLRIILPGMCYRYEQVSARTEIQFTQVDGLAVGKRVTFGDLKGTISDFARRLFGQHVRTRFRADHFPFTEPSAEVDFECFLCNGRGCMVCKHTGWLEIMGCGMVHPVVLSNGGYDPRRYSGFAFGIGPERIALLRYRIEDIRDIWTNDLRFLEQFA